LWPHLAEGPKKPCRRGKLLWHRMPTSMAQTGPIRSGVLPVPSNKKESQLLTKCDSRKRQRAE
jgi:hypothetical protein